MAGTINDSRRNYLEERIVFCANCDQNRRLCTSPDGHVCSTCASRQWMYLPSAITRQSSVAAAARSFSVAVRKVVQNLSSPGLMQIVADLGAPAMEAVKRASNSQLPIIESIR